MPYIGKQPANVPVTADDIPANSIDASKIIDGAITIADIADDAVTADKLANSINTAIAANTAKTGITSSQTSAITANTAKTGITSSQATAITAALPKAGGAMTGTITNLRSTGIDDNANALAMTIDSSEKIIIGDATSHTTDLLQIETPASGGGHGIQIRRNDTNTGQGVGHILFGNNTATDLAKIAAGTDGAADSGYLILATQPANGNLTDRMTINSSGNVGIGSSSAGGKLEIHQEQVTGQFDRDCFLRLHPSAHTNSGGFTNMMFGTSTTNNFGVAIGGLRAGTDNAPSFRINMLNDSVNGFNALTIDSTGRVTKPLQPAFLANLGTAVDLSTTEVQLKFTSEYFDVGNNHNGTTGRFTAPVAGVYMVTWGGTTYMVGAEAYATTFVKRNGSNYQGARNRSHNYSGNRYSGQTITLPIHLDASDYITIHGYCASNNTAVSDNEYSFGVYLLG